MFDAIMKLRDALFRNDVNGVNQGIGLMDEVVSNLTQALGEIGGKQRKTEDLVKRHTQDKLYTTEIYSKIQSVDMAESIMNLRELENTHRAAIQVGARILRPSLLDFLR
jgi:flagellar hook-associated protein 3 FlgL